MRYAVARPDGGVSILECAPVRAISPDGQEFKVEGFKQFADNANVYLRSETQTAVLKTSSDFKADGWKIGFSDPRAELDRRLTRAQLNANIAAIANPAERTRAEGNARTYIASDDVVTITPITAADIPSDRTFRDGWQFNGASINHDMAKCREIHKGRIREARVPQLAALDVDFMRAVERGDNAGQARIAAEKQKLRDVTDDPGIASAATPEELKAVWPSALESKPSEPARGRST